VADYRRTRTASTSGGLHENGNQKSKAGYDRRGNQTVARSTYVIRANACLIAKAPLLDEARDVLQTIIDHDGKLTGGDFAQLTPEKEQSTNMETKHTPGPWIVRDHEDQNKFTVECLTHHDSLRSIIAEVRETWLCPEHVGEGDQAPRIARLIAKAPLLDEAREFCQAVIARIQGEWDNPALRKWGPLSTDVETDIKDFARALLAKLDEK